MKKKITILVMALLGLYWLIDHAAPLPLNHEQFGLYNHTAHRILGVLFLAASGFALWKWKK